MNAPSAIPINSFLTVTPKVRREDREPSSGNWDKQVFLKAACNPQDKDMSFFSRRRRGALLSYVFSH
jgi:hypothetical protein